MSKPYSVSPVESPVIGSLRPPGSKSITNRALIVAALAKGTSHLRGVLNSQDTQVMLESLRRMGLNIEHRTDIAEVIIEGCGGKPAANSADLWLENSGTSIRFLTAFCSLGTGTFRLDGNERMRQRPIRDLVETLNSLGVDVTCESKSDSAADTIPDCPPVLVNAAGLNGGTAEIAGEISSQYLSGLLMASPAAESSVTLKLQGKLVSKPYIEMTMGVMARFGVIINNDVSGTYRIEPQSYTAIEYDVEPDATASSYFFAAAAITGGRVTVEGLSAYALQGDIKFVDVLENMGCKVDRQPDRITVQGGDLKGVEIDMNEISDTAQTLAVVAIFADGPTTIRNVAHMRVKETDRISALVTELRRMGLQADEFEDGLTIHPGVPHPTCIQTYDDHRMAMSFALAGLKVPGIEIANPECTQKTYPQFFTDLETICRNSP